MGTKPTTVLLVGETARSSQELLEWLNKRSYHCQTSNVPLVPRTITIP
jgi:hypothetical protein